MRSVQKSTNDFCAKSPPMDSLQPMLRRYIPNEILSSISFCFILSRLFVVLFYHEEIQTKYARVRFAKLLTCAHNSILHI